MKTIAVYIGGRANYSSAKPLIAAINNHPMLDGKVILGGAAALSRYGDLRPILVEDGIEPAFVVTSVIEGETPHAMAKSIGLGVIDQSSFLELLRPDWAIAIGDRYDVLAWVLAAAAMNVPIAHTMGGERSGTIDESIRHAITKFANLHFPANQDAADRIVKMGECPSTVHMVGCPRMDFVLDCLARLKKEKLYSSDEFFREFGGVGSVFDLDNEEFLLVSFHPVTTEYFDNNNHVNEMLSALNELKVNTIMIWPNADAGSDGVSKAIRSFREKHNPEWLHLFVNLPLDAYVQLMDQCACMIGNSSSALREGETVGVPAVNIGTRQNMRLKGANVIDVEPNRAEIMDAIKSQIAHGRFESSYMYGTGNSSKQIAEILANTEISTTQKVNMY